MLSFLKVFATRATEIALMLHLPSEKKANELDWHAPCRYKNPLNPEVLSCVLTSPLSS